MVIADELVTLSPYPFLDGEIDLKDSLGHWPVDCDQIDTMIERNWGRNGLE